MLKRIFSFFSKPGALAALNFVLLAALVAGNSIWPVACVPTLWASIVLGLCFTSTAVYPLVKNRSLSMVISAINGLSFFVFIYFIIFLGHMNFTGLVFIIIGLGLLTFIPHFLLGQLLRNYLIKPKCFAEKKLFLSGLGVALLILCYSGISYYSTAKSLSQIGGKEFADIEKSFMTEKILGMHFIYHTRFCPWDGWRPPKHEPLLVMGLWLNGYSPIGNGRNADPLKLSLSERISLYQSIYPDRRIKFDCACSFADNAAYHGEEILK